MDSRKCAPKSKGKGGATAGVTLSVLAALKAAGIAVRPPGGWGRRAAKPANEGITDLSAAKPATPVIPDLPNPENPAAKGKATSKPANEVITDSEVITDPNPLQRDEVGASSSEQVASPQRQVRSLARRPLPLSAPKT